VNDDGKRAIDGPQRSAVGGLWRRIYLTYKYHGFWSVILRVITFPLRFTPLRRYVEFGRPKSDQTKALRWYRKQGTPVTIVIPSYRDAEHVAALVASIRATTDRRRVRIVVADDSSGPDHIAALRRIEGIEVVESPENTGFAANVNRGLRATDTRHDVVVLNSDMTTEPGWLASLQYAASRGKDIGIVGGRLL
jgi:hypothetical protein